MSRFSGFRNWLRPAAFVYLSAVIMVMASERVYWYWAGFTPDSVLGLAGFYVIPVWAGLWALAAHQARRLHHVVLASAVFAAVVEGVLTPIIYADGPLPIMAFMFIGWHGMVAFVGFWYLARKWLVQGSRRLLARASAAAGVGWGAWAAAAVTDQATADLAAEGIEATVLVPSQFALYAFAVGGTLVLAHWLLGFVWPRHWRPNRAGTWAPALAAAAYMAVAVLPAVPWAPVKLAVLVGGPLWLLARGGGQPATEPTLWERLAGRIRLRDAALMLWMPAAAAITYGGSWGLATSDTELGGVYWVLVVAQVLGGAVAIVWAIRRAWRPPLPGAPGRVGPESGEPEPPRWAGVEIISLRPADQNRAVARHPGQLGR